MNHGPEDFIIPSAPINEEDVELVHELVHPHHHHHALEQTLVEDAEPTDALLGEAEEEEEFDREWRQKLPWWKRPSPWWYVTSRVRYLPRVFKLASTRQVSVLCAVRGHCDDHHCCGEDRALHVPGLSGAQAYRSSR